MTYCHILPVLLLLCCTALAEGFFLPVFVRKQAPQTPAVNNAQWASASSPAASIVPQPNTAMPYQSLKEYSPYQNQMQATQMTQLQPVQTYQPLQTMNQLQYSFDPYSQMQSAFHSVQLVPCLCPISKEVIEQQSQQMKQQQASTAAHQQTVESGSNSVMVQGSHKITS